MIGSIPRYNLNAYTGTKPANITVKTRANAPIANSYNSINFCALQANVNPNSLLNKITLKALSIVANTIGLKGIKEIHIIEKDKVASLINQGYRVVLTPNHRGHGDTLVILHTLDKINFKCYMMKNEGDTLLAKIMPKKLREKIVAATGFIATWAGKNNRKAIETSINLLKDNKMPLIIFPEGRPTLQGNAITELKYGTAKISLEAAKDNKVAILPVGIKYKYIKDAANKINRTINKLKKSIGLPKSSTEHSISELTKQVEKTWLDVIKYQEMRFLGTESDYSDLNQAHKSVADKLFKKLADELKIDSEDPKSEVIKIFDNYIYNKEKIKTREFQSANEEKEIMKNHILPMYKSVQKMEYTSPEYLSKGEVTQEKLMEIALILRGIANNGKIVVANQEGSRKAIIKFGTPILLDKKATEVSRTEVQNLTNELKKAMQSNLDSIG